MNGYENDVGYGRGLRAIEGHYKIRLSGIQTNVESCLPILDFYPQGAVIRIFVERVLSSGRFGRRSTGIFDWLHRGFGRELRKPGTRQGKRSLVCKFHPVWF